MTCSFGAEKREKERERVNYILYKAGLHIDVRTQMPHVQKSSVGVLIIAIIKNYFKTNKKLITSADLLKLLITRVTIISKKSGMTQKSNIHIPLITILIKGLGEF